MLRLPLSLALLLGLNLSATSVFAQSVDSITSTVPVVTTAANDPSLNPDYCINTMAGFASDNHEIRYQFFRLTEEIGRDMTPNLRKAMNTYGNSEIAGNVSILDAMEDAANPVLRQAAPDMTIANMTTIVDFAYLCKPVIAGQINSLKAFDRALDDASFNAVIVEDALFLRQILSDSLFRQGADKNPLYKNAVEQYAKSLVKTRDDAEFTSFEAELGDLESLFMNDLDGRLKRSNDMINEEMDGEILGDSVALSDSMNRAEQEKAKERQLYTLIQILGGGG